MAEELKKVTYSFIRQAGFTPDEEEQKELDELARKREGLLHRIIEKDDNGVIKTFAVVEDAATGEIHELELSLVQVIA